MRKCSHLCHITSQCVNKLTASSLHINLFNKIDNIIYFSFSSATWSHFSSSAFSVPFFRVPHFPSKIKKNKKKRSCVDRVCGRGAFGFWACLRVPLHTHRHKVHTIIATALLLLFFFLLLDRSVGTHTRDKCLEANDEDAAIPKMIHAPIENKRNEKFFFFLFLCCYLLYCAL